jgi:hypothetical protein
VLKGNSGGAILRMKAIGVFFGILRKNFGFLKGTGVEIFSKMIIVVLYNITIINPIFLIKNSPFFELRIKIMLRILDNAALVQELQLNYVLIKLRRANCGSFFIEHLELFIKAV